MKLLTPTLVLGALLAAGCSSGGSSSSTTNGNTAPEVMLVRPDQPLLVEVGDPVEIEFTDRDPDSAATSRVVAVPIDFQALDETLPEILIAEIPENDGATQLVTWSTEDVFPTRYVIEVRTSDEESTTVGSSPLVEIEPKSPSASDIQVFQGQLTAFRTAAMPGGATALVGLYRNPLRLAPDQIGAPIVSTVSGATELVVARFLADGTLDWVRYTQSLDLGLSPGFQADQLDLAATSDGRLVVGVTADDGFDLRDVNQVHFSAFLSALGRSAVIFSLEETGDLAWALPIGGEPSTILSGLAAGENGSVLLAGSFDGFVSLPSSTGSPLTLSASGQVSGFVARVEATGNPNWLRETELGDVAQAIDVATRDGFYSVLGTFKGLVQFGEGTNTLFASSRGDGRSAYLVVYREDTGSLSWAWEVHGFDDDVVALDLIRVRDGWAFSTLATGKVELTASSSVQYTNDSETSDLYVTRVQDNTLLAYMRRIVENAGPTAPTNHLATLEDEEDFLLVAGELTTSTVPETWSGPPFEAVGGTDTFVGLLDDQGTFLAGQRDGGAGVLRLLSLGTRGNGQPILGVRAEGEALVGTNTEEPREVLDESAIVPVAPFAL